jgi:hypothetical protein
MIRHQKLIVKLRPAVKWHGGKAYLARRIIERLPDEAKKATSRGTPSPRPFEVGP